MFLTLPPLSPSKRVSSEYTLAAPIEAALKFESRFESGNLNRASRVSEDEYNLTLEFDFHTKGHTQWYYFSACPYKVPHVVRFNLNNLVKLDSLYNEGLKPCVYSLKEHQATGLGWHRAGSSVAYFKSQELRPGSQQSYYTLTFVYEFKHPQDTVYFAHCYPYTYSDLEAFLREIELTHSEICRVDTLCQTLAKNNCKVLTITQGVQSYQSWPEELEKMKKSAGGRKLIRLRSLRQEAHARALEHVRNIELPENEHGRKKGVYLSARVHPGESNSSYMMQGAIAFLLSDCKEARTLRKLYVFKIIPMLNPDGVIYGNYRCSLLGVDLNRRWLQPSKHLHPTIYYAKRLLLTFSEDREVVMSLDMHGHSMKRNSFIYGCASKSQDIEDKRKSLFVRLIPYLLAERNPLFSFEDCRFRLEKSKESTQRVVVHKAFEVLNSYTIEASFYGPKDPTALGWKDQGLSEGNSDCHMDKSHLESIGRDVCKVLLTLSNPTVLRRKLADVCTLINSVKPSSVVQRLSSKVVVSPETEDPTEDCEASDVLPLDISDILNSVETQAIERMQLCDEDSEGSDKCPSDNDEKKWELPNPKIKKRLPKRKKSTKTPLPFREDKPKKPEPEKVRKPMPRLPETPYPSRLRYSEQQEGCTLDIKKQVDRIYSMSKN